MRITFEGTIKSLKRGTGYLRLPPNHTLKTKGKQLKISICVGDKRLQYYKPLKGKLCPSILYVPKELMSSHLLEKNACVVVETVTGFVSRSLNDGRIYIPSRIAKGYGLKDGDAIRLQISDASQSETMCVKIHLRQRTSTREYFFMTRKLYWRKKECNITILKKLKKRAHELFDNEDVYGVDKGVDVAFYGNCVPIIIATNIRPRYFSYYLGAYLADGTRKGNYWRINASTPEQALYYIKQHKRLIQDGSPRLSLTYTDIRQKGERQCTSELIRKWMRSGITITPNRVYIINRKGTGERGKWNPFGSLSIYEQRLLILSFYNHLLSRCLDDILEGRDRNAAIDFICGVLEGDGSVAAKGRGHITITTNGVDKDTLKRVLDVWGVKYNIYQEGENRWYIRIGALQILKYLPLLHKKLFTLYPTRRKRLARLFDVGAAQYILGRKKVASSWVKAWLRDEGIVDERYLLTPHGKEIRKCLISMQNSMET